jgi:hypothetical protein
MIDSVHVERGPAAAAMMHYALLVESIEASVAHLRETAGLDFRSPARIPFVVAGHDETYEHEVRACYTVDMSVELVETAHLGPFAGAHRFGLHHYGGAVADLQAEIEQQRAHGNHVEWELSYDKQLIAVFFAGTASLPGRLEFVSGQAPPLLDMFAEVR